MNKKILIVLFILIGAASFFFIRKALVPKEEIVLDQTNKTFVVAGDVQIKKAGEGTKWQKMTSATVLEKGDMVKTAPESTVDIVIGNETDKMIRLKQKTRAEFEGINPTRVNLSEGAALVAIRKLEPKSSFVVRTPAAICGARGTAWMQEAHPAKTIVSVFENQIYINAIDAKGKPKKKEYVASEGSRRILVKGEPISGSENIPEKDLIDWKYWSKAIEYLRVGKILIDDFDRKENFNNLAGDFGSWNIFYSDENQYCRDEFAAPGSDGKGMCLKVSYSVDSPYSAYNGFFTRLQGIDISKYRYLIFYVKGDKTEGFTTTLSLEIKNRAQIGKATIEGITDEWKRYSVPLAQFAGINDFTDMKEIVIVFSDIKVTKKRGAIYLDDIYFAKTEAGD